MASANLLKHSLSTAGHVLNTTRNLIDEIWVDRPPAARGRIMIHPLKYAGSTHESKIASIQAQLLLAQCWGLVVTALDEIAWLFNLRGSDIPFSPVFYSYALILPTQAILYVDGEKVNDEVGEEKSISGTKSSQEPSHHQALP